MAKKDFNIHLHFATDFALQAVHNLNSIGYSRSLGIPEGVNNNVAWTRQNLERALLALGAFELERKTGAEVDTDYIDHGDNAVSS
jgi:hypothetical protein